jgi:hypothetical protein
LNLAAFAAINDENIVKVISEKQLSTKKLDDSRPDDATVRIKRFWREKKARRKTFLFWLSLNLLSQYF